VLIATTVVVAIMLVTAVVGVALAVRNRSPSAQETPSNSAPLPQPLERSVDELDRVVEP
jgi:hypothetical protein